MSSADGLNSCFYKLQNVWQAELMQELCLIFLIFWNSDSKYKLMMYVLASVQKYIIESEDIVVIITVKTFIKFYYKQ